MIEAAGTLELIRLLRQGGASPSRIENLMKEPELAKMFPALGIPLETGVRYLSVAAGSGPSNGSDGVENVVVPYFQELARGLAHLRTLLDELNHRERTLVNAAAEATARYLPSGCDLEGVRLVILPLGLDFRTDRDAVYMDPLAALQLGFEGIRTTLAHELHHVGRWRLTGENLTLMKPHEANPPLTTPDSFRWWATWLEAEGVADCVSSVTDTDVPILQPAVERRRQQVSDYRALLSQALQGFRTHGREDSHSPRPRAPTLGDLLSIAHPVGFQLARSIQMALGRPDLVECVGDPARFLTRYNRSSRAQDFVRIDEEMIRWVEPGRGSGEPVAAFKSG